MNDSVDVGRPPRGVKLCTAIRSADSQREERIEYKGVCGCAVFAYILLSVVGFVVAWGMLSKLNFQVESARWSAIVVSTSVILISCCAAFGILMCMLTRHSLVVSGTYGYYIDEFSLFNRTCKKKVWRFPLDRGTKVDVRYTYFRGVSHGVICISNFKRRGFAVNSVELSDGEIQIGEMLSENDRVLNYFAEWIRQRIART